MRNKVFRTVGIGLLTTGIAILIITGFLIVKLNSDEKHAEEASKRAMDVLRLAAEQAKRAPITDGEPVLPAKDESLSESVTESSEAENTGGSPEAAQEGKKAEEAPYVSDVPGGADEEDDQEETLMIDGIGYLGYLSFPEFGTELPGIADWDFEMLKDAPMRYNGTLEENDIVIAGHAYDVHFRFFEDEQPGNRIVFTDLSGNDIVYRIIEKEVLQPTEIERMITGDWDMTLFTCTYSGKARLALRCERT